jgi:hypothetical protein
MPFGSGGPANSGNPGSNTNNQVSSPSNSSSSSMPGVPSTGSSSGGAPQVGAIQYMKNILTTACHGVQQGPAAAVHQGSGANDGRRRENAFYMQGGENNNPFPVIYNPNVPTSSAGYADRTFFETLGNPMLWLDTLERQAEQEYILQGMPKGALYEAASIADRYKIGIAVRPTGVLAHPGIESGNPTKAQEFKNKTSKEVDLWLCDEMTYFDVGAVVHYDPRVGWSSGDSSWSPAPKRKEPDDPAWDQWFEQEWAKKQAHILLTRAPQIDNRHQVKKPGDPTWTEADWAKLKALFKSRMIEYAEEDEEYRDGGDYFPHVVLKGPFIHLKLRPDDHMYGDHDLFGFTNADNHVLEHDSTSKNGMAAQKALQDADTFQAQHGGIWNWNAPAGFQSDIKNKIMSAHSPPDGEPLIYILPGGIVIVAWYISPDKIVPVWERGYSTSWLKSTPSGDQLHQQMKRRSPRVGVP